MTYNPRLEDDNEPKIKRDSRRLGALALFLLLSWCTAPIWNWERRSVPTELSMSWIVDSTSSFGLREGCQYAVFRLAPWTTRLIRKGGISYLTSISKPGSGQPNNPWGSWQETPGDIDLKLNGHGSNRTIFGLYALGGCSGSNGVAAAETRLIEQALAQPGSFYQVTANDEGILIVVPREGLAAFAYSG